MLTGHEKLRSDLVVSEQKTTEGASFVIKDPTLGRFFRFREPEHFIAAQLDGDTSLEVIQRRAEERFGATVARDSLVQFVEKLGRLGLLETERAPREIAGHGRGRVQGGPLALRVKVFDPDRLFSKLDAKVRFFFTPYFLVVSDR